MAAIDLSFPSAKSFADPAVSAEIINSMGAKAETKSIDKAIALEMKG